MLIQATLPKVSLALLGCNGCNGSTRHSQCLVAATANENTEVISTGPPFAVSLQSSRFLTPRSVSVPRVASQAMGDIVHLKIIFTTEVGGFLCRRAEIPWPLRSRELSKAATET
ncbi:hypothetical protein B0H65DRAFT_463112 [Neurospora tetraspora]|uniref:Uncharacterized protein n=1 Tax=Neurospora tetraspora TaxID=94610 RepID=A0AAE0MTX4_9PEZI|nr:hypothetical protein B0H65DRAFT_463112 [Neurospora tetraspora]